MQNDKERQEIFVMLVDMPAEQGRQDHGVTEATDGKKFRHALQHGDDESLRKSDGCIHARS
jgi:hypothetical protein